MSIPLPLLVNISVCGFFFLIHGEYTLDFNKQNSLPNGAKFTNHFAVASGLYEISTHSEVMKMVFIYSR